MSVTAAGRGTAFLRAEWPSGDAPLVVRLEAAHATLTGRVRWADGGGPVAAELRAHRYSDDAGAVFYTEADANGAFALALPPGTYLLLPVVEGGVPSPVEVDADHDRSVDFDLVRAGPVPDAVVAWIRGAARPLSSLDPGFPPDDLVRLAPVFAGARIVGVGEPTHGSREPICFWTRLFEHLAQEEGFTILALETTFMGGLAADRYVQGGPGSARQAAYDLKLFSQEAVDLLDWLRRTNELRAGRPRLHVAGVDLNPPAPAARLALEALDRADPAAASALRADLGVLTDERTQFDLSGLSEERRAAVRRGAESLRTALQERERGRVAEPGEDWGLAVQCARNVERSVEMQLAPGSAASVAARDLAMAENAAWLLERHGGNLLLGAHNGHVAVKDGWMGRFLRDRWGRGYRALGFVFDRGSFRATEYAFGRAPRGWGNTTVFEVGPTPVGSLANALAQAGLPMAVVDLGALPAEGPVRDWFRYGRASWYVGAGFFARFAPAFLKPVVAPQAFDALVFVERTTAATPLP